MTNNIKNEVYVLGGCTEVDGAMMFHLLAWSKNETSDELLGGILGIPPTSVDKVSEEQKDHAWRSGLSLTRNQKVFVVNGATKTRYQIILGELYDEGLLSPEVHNRAMSAINSM